MSFLWGFVAGDIIGSAIERAGRPRRYWYPDHATQPRPGWYDDPADSARLRWWDGHQWSDQRTPPRQQRRSDRAG
jgi:hypothetical protein